MILKRKPESAKRTQRSDFVFTQTNFDQNTVLIVKLPGTTIKLLTILRLERALAIRSFKFSFGRCLLTALLVQQLSLLPPKLTPLRFGLN